MAGGDPGPADREFRGFLSADWAKWMAEWPETATLVGFPGHDDRWTDDSPVGVTRRRDHLRESLEALRALDAGALSPRERLNYKLYRSRFELADAGLEYGFDANPFVGGWPRSLLMPLHQMDGVHLNAGQLLALQGHASVGEYDAILERLRRLPTFVDQEVVLLRAGLAKGFSPPGPAVQGVPDQIATLIPDDPRASALLAPFREFPTTIREGDRTRLLETARDVYVEAVRPAFERLLEYVRQDYLPHCRSSVAASTLPPGPAYYRFLVRWTTTLDLTPEAIHAIGLSEVRRLRAEMEAVMRASGFQGSFAEFNRFLQSDPRFFFARADELLDGYRAIAKRIDPELARHFGRLPRSPYGVIPVPEYQAPSSPAAYYIPGSVEAGRAGYFFANTFDLASRPKWRMEPLTLHEAVPGHHLQLALADELEDAPEFRRHSGTTSFEEGWGLYAESLGEELGLYRDPYAKYAALEFDMWRSIRLVVDTGMHALGWSRERAIDFFRENTGMSMLDITVEVDRYIVVPSQALAYKMGQMKILELRRFAQATLGDRFNEREFHDRVLEEGALPLGELDRRLREWVESAKARGMRP